MIASEALFDGHPVAHVVAHYERQRFARIDELNKRARRDRRASRKD